SSRAKSTLSTRAASQESRGLSPVRLERRISLIVAPGLLDRLVHLARFSRFRCLVLLVRFSRFSRFSRFGRLRLLVRFVRFVELGRQILVVEPRLRLVLDRERGGELVSLRLAPEG